MYNPSHFKQDDPQVLHEWMTHYPLATVVTLSSHGLNASHIPLLHDTAPGGFGVLRGHMAKANPQWSDLTPGVRALAIFTGPQHYVTPSWYPSNTEHGKVVPTWNYVVVHAQGPMRVIEDPAWLRRNVAELTAAHEASFPNPWTVSGVPAGYIDSLLNAIVGIEITIETLEGKCKASQNRPEADQLGVITGLHDLRTAEADRMAEVVSLANQSRSEEPLNSAAFRARKEGHRKGGGY